MLQGKTVVLGVTGGIAAYKACEIVSRLRKLGANVHVILTKHAAHFVGPVTFQALSNNMVATDMFESPITWDTEHISLAQKADIFVVAPATANIIGKMASGIADDMLSTTIMATKAPILLAPAMNTGMYTNPVVQRNMEDLKGLGVHFVDPAAGRLACGDIGVGKLEAPEVIVDRIQDILLTTHELAGKKVVITGGPTVEDIDPVRFLSNRSSGAMGLSIAKAARRMGAEVVLVSGPTTFDMPAGVECHQVRSAREMADAVAVHDDFDIFIASAAVSDYRPAEASDKKIKKTDEDLVIRLERNPDILKTIGNNKKAHQFVVGFAAETDHVLENAKTKIQKKNLDMIVANDVTVEGAGFGCDTNIVQIIKRSGEITPLEKMSKDAVAMELLKSIANSL